MLKESSIITASGIVSTFFDTAKKKKINKRSVNFILSSTIKHIFKSVESDNKKKLSKTLVDSLSCFFYTVFKDIITKAKRYMLFDRKIIMGEKKSRTLKWEYIVDIINKDFQPLNISFEKQNDEELTKQKLYVRLNICKGIIKNFNTEKIRFSKSNIIKFSLFCHSLITNFLSEYYLSESNKKLTLQNLNIFVKENKFWSKYIKKNNYLFLGCNTFVKKNKHDIFINQKKPFQTLLKNISNSLKTSEFSVQFSKNSVLLLQLFFETYFINTLNTISGMTSNMAEMSNILTNLLEDYVNYNTVLLEENLKLLKMTAIKRLINSTALTKTDIEFKKVFKVSFYLFVYKFISELINLIMCLNTHTITCDVIYLYLKNKFDINLIYQ